MRRKFCILTREIESATTLVVTPTITGLRAVQLKCGKVQLSNILSYSCVDYLQILGLDFLDLNQSDCQSDQRFHSNENIRMHSTLTQNENFTQY